MSAHNEKTIKQAIDEMLRAYHLDDGMREAKVKEAWQKLMGKIILKHTIELRLKNHVLHVKLNSSVVRHELSMERTKIIEQINTEIKEAWVKDIFLS